MYPMPITRRIEETSLHWIWLHHNDTISTAAKKRLLDIHGSPDAVYRSLPVPLGVSESWSRRPTYTLEQAVNEYDRMKQRAIDFLPYTDCRYRRVVAEDPLAPLLLFHKGVLFEPERPVVQIIGDSCPEFELERTILQYRRKGFVIATSVGSETDPMMLETIMTYGGRTMLFCDGTMDRWYPSHLEPLLARCKHKWTLLNCDAPETLPAEFHRIRRSRLLSLWCDVSVVVGRVDSIVSRAAMWYAGAAHRPLYSHGQPMSMGTKGICPISCSPIGSESARICNLMIDLLRFVTLSTEELSKAVEVDETTVLGLLIDMELCGSVVSTRQGKWKSRLL